MAGYRLIPKPKYDRDVARLVLYYKKAFKDSAVKLYSIKYGIERQQAESLMNQITFILQQLDADTKKWCEEVIPKAYQDGQYRAIMSIGEVSSLAEAASLSSFSMLARDTVEALVNDTYADLLIATKNTETKIKQLVRSVVSDTMRVRAIEQLGRKTQRNDITGRLARQGLSKNLNSEGWVGIVDSAGRRWNLSTYADMVVRTKLQQAHVEGIRVECLERKVDLAVVSSHGATDSCRFFEGMVISLNGVTKGYPTYAELRASNRIFHPNCQHSVNPVRTLSLLPKEAQDKHFEKLAGMEKVIGKKFEPQTVLTPGAAAVRPKAQKWAASKTVEEAEQLMSELYPHIRWDFKGCHVDVINPSTKEFDRLAREYPKVAARLEYVGTYKGSKSPQTYTWNDLVYAHASRDGKRIGINPTWYGQPQKFQASIDQGDRDGFHTKGANFFASVMTHEFGHQVWNQLAYEYSKKSLVPIVRSSGWGTGREFFRDWQEANRATAKLSVYATKNAAESWAEAFTVNSLGLEGAKLKYPKAQKAFMEYVKSAKWYDEDEWELLSSFSYGPERDTAKEKASRIEAELLKEFEQRKIVIKTQPTYY